MKNKKEKKKAPRRFPEIRWEGKENEGKKKINWSLLSSALFRRECVIPLHLCIINLRDDGERSNTPLTVRGDTTLKS
jgi:hypothetical protein